MKAWDNFIQGLKIMAGYQHPYDALQRTETRRQAPQRVSTVDDLLPSGDRMKAISEVRELERNFGDARFMADLHIDHTCQYSYHSEEEDEGLADAVEAYVESLTNAANFDAAGQRGLWEFLAMLERRAIFDGDCFAVFKPTGHWEGVTGDRISGQAGWGKTRQEDWRRKREVNGVILAKDGPAAYEYMLCYREKGMLKFADFWPAAMAVQHGFFDSFDQVRGVSPLLPVHNWLRDKFEAVEYHIARMKLAAVMGISIYRDGVAPEERQDIGGDNNDDDDDDDKQTESAYSGLSIAPGAVFIQEMGESERMEMLESKSPAVEIQRFLEQITMATMRGAFGMPYSFYDEAHTNYAGQRRAIAQYELHLNRDRARVRRTIHKLITMKMAFDISEGNFKLPGNRSPFDLRYSLIPACCAWVDPEAMSKSDIAAIDAGLINRDMVIRMRTGRSLKDIAREIGREKKIMDKYGATPAPDPQEV